MVYMGKMIVGDDVGMFFFVIEVFVCWVFEVNKFMIEVLCDELCDEGVVMGEMMMDGSMMFDGGSDFDFIGFVGCG